MLEANTDEFFYRNKQFLSQYLRRGATTIRHMFAQLLVAEFFIRYGDGATTRRLIDAPRFEYPINGEWRTDIMTDWRRSSYRFREIVEVQAEYTWNISFTTHKEGAEIVDALEKEGLLTPVKAKDYRDRYLRTIRKHESTNRLQGRTKDGAYIGHIAFRHRGPLWGKSIAGWEVNNESDLERKVRQATQRPHYKRPEEHKGPEAFDFISFAIPTNDMNRFVKDARILRKKPYSVKLGCIYSYEDSGISQFDKEVRALGRTVRLDGQKPRGKGKTFDRAQQKLKQLEEEFYGDYRRDELRDMLVPVFVDLEVPRNGFPRIDLDH
jgi:hypothetical protein